MSNPPDPPRTKQRIEFTSLIQPAKSLLKRLLSASLYRTGLLWLAARIRLRGKAVVLMYHRILPLDESRRSFSHPGIIVTPRSFARHLNILRRHFKPLTLQQFEHHLVSGEPFPHGACLLTFDDGWLDNHTYALPLLQEHGVPAVVFVATDYIETANAFWQERLGHLLYEATVRGIGGALLKDRTIELGDSHDEQYLRSRVARIVDDYRRRPYDDIHSLIDGLEQAFRIAGQAAAIAPRDRFMNWNQVIALAEGGIAIGSHSSSHRILTRLDPRELDDELSVSRSLIAKRLNREVPALAYPNGDVDERVRRQVQDLGYRLAFTTQEGFLSPTVNALLIPRINIHEAVTCTDALFLCRILRLF